MDRKEIIRMALEAGLPGAGDHDFRGGFDKMTRPEQDLLLAVEYFAELVAAKERDACGRKPLTSAQMAAGREAIFSTGNPYCPCDAKTFRKVAEWVERHHGITEATDGK